MNNMDGIKILLALTTISFLSTNAFAETNVTEIIIYTDSSWKSFDATVKGWTSIDFDDSYWPNAEESDKPVEGYDKARSIWFPQKPTSGPYYYRKIFELSGTEILSGKIYYNNYYWSVYLNENRVGNDADIVPFLKIGKNIITAERGGGQYGDVWTYAKIRVVTNHAHSSSPFPSPSSSTIMPTPTATLQPSISDTSPPSISISKQIVDFNKNGQLEEGEKLIITYGASDESSVKSIKILVDGNLIELQNNEGTYSVTTDSLSMGEHSIIVEAIDSKGNKKSEEMKVKLLRAGPSVYFPKSKYEVNEGEDVNIVLAAVNPIGNPKMEALLILKPPSNGVSISESDNCKSLAGMCTGQYEIVSGDNVKPISVRMRADRAGEYQIDAEVYYQFDGQKSPTRYETLTLVVKPKATQTSTATATVTSKPNPGFGVIISISGLLLITLLRKRLLKKSFNRNSVQKSDMLLEKEMIEPK